MSNWRISFGLGPIRYIRSIGGKPRQKKPTTAMGVILTLVVTLGLMYLCCWGGVAFLSRDVQ